MRQIQPYVFPVRGQNVTANYFDMNISYDNLNNKAIFKYYLISVTEVQEEVSQPDEQVATVTNTITEILLKDTIELSGTDYVNWGSMGGDINDDAFTIVTGLLNLTLV
jgi:hypothetical protein